MLPNRDEVCIRYAIHHYASFAAGAAKSVHMARRSTPGPVNKGRVDLTKKDTSITNLAVLWHLKSDPGPISGQVYGMCHTHA